MEVIDQIAMIKMIRAHLCFVNHFETIKVFRVIHVGSPSSFYVEHPIPSTSRFANWKERMQIFYNIIANQKEYKVRTSSIKLERLYAFFYEPTQEWRRVRAFAKNVKTGLVKVKLVDNGYIIDTTEDKLFELHPRFISWPVMATKVKLHGVVPVEDEGWSTEAISNFKDLVIGRTFFGICPVFMRRLVHGDIIPLVLYEKTPTRSTHSLQQELVRMGSALFSPDSIENKLNSTKPNKNVKP